MATRRRMMMAIILCCAAGLPLRADEEPPQPGHAEEDQSGEASQHADLVQTTVNYDKAMLVAVSKEGAAGIRFIDAFELGNKSGNGVVGVSYEWRFVARKPGAEEQTGNGRVFAKLVDGDVRDGSFAVTCGLIELTWAYKDKASGVVRYNPRDVSVHPVAAERFAARQVAARNAPLTVPPIALSLFLQLDEDVPATRTAGPVLYGNSVLVVRDRNGIATFEFGTAFERAKGANQTLFGVPYDFTFVSPEGETQEGDGEVYETYTDGKYDRGLLDFKAGPLQIHWSRGGDELGWIYYDPARNPIWCVDQPYVKRLVGVIAADARAAEGGD